MSGFKNVVIAIGGRFSYGARITQGVLNYWNQQGRLWELHIASHPAFSLDRGIGGSKWFSRFKDEVVRRQTDGIIAYFGSIRLAEAVGRLGLPVVNVSSMPLDVPNMSHVVVDNLAVGAMAARYYLEQGFGSFGYLDTSDAPYLRRRLDGYRLALREAGHDPQVCRAGRFDSLDLARIDRWVRVIKRPAAVMCSQDLLARETVSICRRIGIRNPDDLALVGVDNDPLICVPCPVPISSVDTATEHQGYLAAATLDRKMSGLAVPAQTLVAPTRVVVRESSDIVAIDDAAVSAVLRFIREQASRPIAVKDILREVPISRRALEVRFKRKVGRTLRMEICRAHMERAKRLLIDTDASVTAVASQCGFTHAEAFYAVFRREVKMTPLAYREQFRVPRSPGDLHLADSAPRAVRHRQVNANH